MERLWPEMQQELKIIESEEELSLAAAAPETWVSELPSTPSGKEKLVGNPPAGPDVSLFGAPSKDSPVSDSKLCRKQDGAAFTLLKLENIPCGTTSPKDSLEGQHTRSDLPLHPQDWKLPSEAHESAVLSREESPCPKEKHLDQPEWESITWLPQRKMESAITQTQREKNDEAFSSRRNLTSSKIFRVVEAHQLKERSVSNQVQDSVDQQEEDACADHMQSLELVEPWEDHQWVTSPLHSPTFKDPHGKEIQLPSHGVTSGKFRKPCFSRSFSLDSKDFVKRHWVVEVPFASAGEEHPCGDSLSGVGEPSQERSRETNKAETWLNFAKEPSKPDERKQKPLSHEAGFGARELPPGHEELCPVADKELSAKQVYEDEENWLESRCPQFNAGDGFLSSGSPESHASRTQEVDRLGTADPCSGEESQISKGEDIPRKGRPRPSSLNLDSVLPAASLFHFESLSVPNPPGHFLCGQKEVKTSDSVPSLPVACPSKDLWGSHFDPQDLDLDYIMMAHATTGRRNSAPVSVSAVRTSFMVKMCQARAVPVIPPKIQYTQVPQPLQTQNPNCRTQLVPENKEAEAGVGQHKPTQVAQGQLQSPKSPTLDRKGKENNNSTLKDSTGTRKAEPSLPNHNSPQDAPVLRRKRTSEGETTGDNPQSSKMERPSGAAKPSYRSRPGRPQSLILFSPPFPIMDHPSSSADSRVLLSPIRSPSQTPSPSPISSDLSGSASEGATLRNKMTIPKNGQRLETSTSCFYQPQRRSVILDGRSGRQIE